MLTSREIEILKIIYEHEEEGIFIVGPALLARKLGISRPSAYEFLLNLSRKGYLIHHKKKGFSLSERGRKEASKVLRAHRILESFICLTLKIDLKKACNYARKLEINAPDEFVEQLYLFLGRPKCCPHGKPIPSVR